MDCSGLVQTVFAQEGMSLPRSCAAQARQGVAVSRGELLQGDLVFFGKSTTPPSHVGIYVGNGRFIHASTDKGKVRRDALSTTWFRQHYRGARRILPASSIVSSNAR
jgi:cell wall-associated NlpC family hydrolase